MASGALSLSENYVLTREAFRDYLDHLTPEGVIFFSRPEFQIPRLVSTAREVFAEQGLARSTTMCLHSAISSAATQRQAASVSSPDCC